jgi:hypothetical protein
MPGTEAAYAELVAVLESLPERESDQAKLLKEQRAAGVVPKDVVLEHRDLGALIAAPGIRAPFLHPMDPGPPYHRLFTLGDAAVLESRVLLAQGDGEAAWRALAPVLEIAGDLQAAGGGLLAWAVGCKLERRVLLELEAVLQTPYGLGPEGERSLGVYLDRRRSEPALLAYASSTQCELTSATLIGVELEEQGVLYDPLATQALYEANCQALVAMLQRPPHARTPLVLDLPSPLFRNLFGVGLVEDLLTQDAAMMRTEPVLYAHRALLSAAVQLRAGYRDTWPQSTLPTNPASGEPVLWEEETLTATVASQTRSLSLLPPMWTQAARTPRDAETGAP